VLAVIMTVNTYRLHRKRQRGENASYDGQESRVTAFDVALSAILGVAAIGAFVYRWATS
jgi:hypothetical protein